jgi:hypothetical protein
MFRLFQACSAAWLPVWHAWYLAASETASLAIAKRRRPWAVVELWLQAGGRDMWNVALSVTPHIALSVKASSCHHSTSASRSPVRRVTVTHRS